jgi:3-oxoacyl-[acyl-carrier-protein] synthase-3
MPPEARILGLSAELPAREVSNRELAGRLAADAESLATRTGVARRFHAAPGEGPSDLALRAAHRALDQAATTAADLGLIVFATATPDVCFPGAACYLQHKLGAPTVGALDIRAQSAGFLCALDLATAFASTPAAPADDSGDPRYARILVAAGEVLSSGLDPSLGGAEMTPRFGDGVAVAVVGPGDRGPRIRALRWRSDGALAERFCCEYPASRHYPTRIGREHIRAGRHYPRAELDFLEPFARDRLLAVAREVLEECSLHAREVDLALIDYVVPRLAFSVARELGIERDRVGVPTAELGHVMAGGLPIELARRAADVGSGRHVLLAAAGPGMSWGAAVLEL